MVTVSVGLRVCLLRLYDRSERAARAATQRPSRHAAAELDRAVVALVRWQWDSDMHSAQDRLAPSWVGQWP